MNWSEALIAVSIPVGRSVAGWIQVSLEDGKVEMFEVRRLFETVFRVGVPAFVAYFGLQTAGLDVSIIAASAGATLFDYIVSWLKKLKTPVEKKKK